MTRFWLLAGAILLAPSAARGQPKDETPPSARLEFKVPGTDPPCLDEPSFRSSVQDALGADPFTTEAATLGLRVVELERNPGALRIRLQLSDADRELGTRELDIALSDCRKARETLALIAAMLLDVPREPTPEPEPAPPPPPEPAPAPPPAPPPKAPRPPAHTARLNVDASALFTLAVGQLPRVAMGGRADLSFQIGQGPLFRASAGGAAGATVETADGRVAFSAIEFGLAAAPWVFAPSARMQLFPFAGATLSSILASASGFDDARSENRFVPAIAAGISLRARPFAAPFLLVAEASASVPLVRPQFTVVDAEGDLEIHGVNALGAGLAVGAGWILR